MKHKLAILGKLLWIGLPLVLAMAGFLLADFHSFGTLTWQYLPDDLFYAISMYLMNYQETMEFDREIFESVIEKVLVGGYNENVKKRTNKCVARYKGAHCEVVCLL